MKEPSPNKITIICTANICRSPLGERLLAQALATANGPVSELEVVSAGVAAAPGYEASAFSIEVLKQEGLDLSDHQSQPLTQQLVDESLFLLAMTESHRQIIDAIFKVRKGQVRLFREFMKPDQNQEIPDPFGGTLVLYKNTLNSVKEAIPSLVQFISENV